MIALNANQLLNEVDSMPLEALRQFLFFALQCKSDLFFDSYLSTYISYLFNFLGNKL